MTPLVDRVVEALAVKLGTPVARQLAPRIAPLFEGYVPGRVALDGLSQAVEDAVCVALSEALGPQMITQRDDGSYVRVRYEALPFLADRCMRALFMAVPPSPVMYAALLDYALRRDSISAMLTLCSRYADRMDSSEHRMLIRILRERMGAAAPAWLGD